MQVRWHQHMGAVDCVGGQSLLDRGECVPNVPMERQASGCVAIGVDDRLGSNAGDAGKHLGVDAGNEAGADKTYSAHIDNL